MTDTIYVYNGNKWEVSERETAIGLCGTSNAGVVSEYGGTYYICRNNAWATATALEYDTYGLKGVEGDVKAGIVNKDKYYVYENGAWRAAANDQEIALGVCTTAREGVVAENGGTYYICKSKTWTTSTALEYDTYGKTCLTDGSIVVGEVVTSNKYVCDAGLFRTASAREISLNKGCVSYTEGDIIRKKKSDKNDSIYTCKTNLWKYDSLDIHVEYGTLLDERDGRIYKTVAFGTQEWMAENLNYADSASYPAMQKRNWCYDNLVSNCTKYGRLYTWVVAMDTAGVFSTNATNCSSRVKCTPTYPVRGICPTGWHLPTGTEWDTLGSTMGYNSLVMMAKSWSSQAIDFYGFSALPAGIYNPGGFEGAEISARFWSATDCQDGDYAVNFRLSKSSMDIDCSGFSYYHGKRYGLSVRCVKNSN